ncbi:hypothetical protein [Kutzneria sp. 744]|uniref:hypothetical protein n=1 Tax=Kutzneria sp. (strain 744) TaxID=345341 RepID=UPI0003EECC1B|nr:hypothetical protein [Kutzneria sp. 744]EWM15589.1 hypothetical protein KUTG_05893 [Kutzneria sp. 744]
MQIGDAMSQFRSDVDSAVARGSRAAGEARARSAATRGQTRELVGRVRARQAQPQPADLTSPGLRRAAASFRADEGLPVDRLPEGTELLAPMTATTPSAPKPPAVAGRRPRPSDDDEDFSQEGIMFRG